MRRVARALVGIGQLMGRGEMKASALRKCRQQGCMQRCVRVCVRVRARAFGMHAWVLRTPWHRGHETPGASHRSCLLARSPLICESGR